MKQSIIVFLILLITVTIYRIYTMKQREGFKATQSPKCDTWTTELATGDPHITVLVIQKLIDDLKNPDNYEAFAREKFFMKKKDEEIYIIEFKDSIKN